MLRTMKTFLLVFGLTALLWADDLVLVDGRYLQVKVQEANERGVRVHLLTTGGELWIPWSLIREDDREALMVRFGLKQEEFEVLVDGVRITTRRGDIWEGVVEGDAPKGQIPEEGLTITHEGRSMNFKPSVIRSAEWVKIPGLSAYKVDQLYQLELGRRAPGDQDMQGHWDMAQVAAAIGAYQEAIKHYTVVQGLDSQYRTEFVQNQLERLEVLAKNARIEQEIKRASRIARAHQYETAQGVLTQILELGDEKLGPDLKTRTEQKLLYIQKQRWEYFKKKVRSAYWSYMEREVAKIARSDLKLKDAMKEVKSDLHERLVNKIAERLGLDPENEVQKMWEEREVHSFRTASYGSGSFVLLGEAKGARQLQSQLEQALRNATGGRNNRRGGRGGNQAPSRTPPLQLPKPPTQDQWWARASSAMKGGFLKCYFAEQGGQLEVVSERYYDCGRCGATGREKHGTSDGVIKIVCTRCHGHRRDKGVAFK